jgi:hypothetical protein
LVLLITAPILGGWALNIWGPIACLKARDEDYRAIGKTRGGQMTFHIVGIFLFHHHLR